MPDPTAKDCLRFLALAAKKVLTLEQGDDFNTAVRTLETLIVDADARAAIAADVAKPAEKAAP